ncbi:MAG: lytic transglycosylase F [Candidatus Zixiibacteriota bacterium]|nr:MAG: lytic transglycosylase F [candidate division Zixibacteria bacterium]
MKPFSFFCVYSYVKARRFHIILFSIIVLVVNACQSPVQTKEGRSCPDINEIHKRGKLIACIHNNSTDYFILKGNPMGFQLELLNNLSDYLNLPIEINVDNNLHSNFTKIATGQCDLVAVGLTITGERKDTISFTKPIFSTRQVLVQRIPKGLSQKQLKDTLISNQLELGNKTIVVEKGSSFIKRLQDLSEEIGEKINIKINDTATSEELISMVSNAIIDYTISDENVAKVNKNYYTNIDISVPISFPQNLAWGVRCGADSLLDTINIWIENFKKTKKFKSLYIKYFKNKRSTENNFEGFISTNDEGKISPYDDIIKDYAKGLHWDWRLLASLIYQESHFNPQAKSWAGAFGLMQLMPTTAARFGVDSLSSPTQQIQAGVGYLKWVNKQLKTDVPDSAQRIYFVLASYNAGLGHVRDAMRLAEKYNRNPKIWKDNVEYFLFEKSNPKYYLDKVVKNGYLRGRETKNHVNQTIERYKHYRNLIPN